MTQTLSDTARTQYERDGFCMTPNALDPARVPDACAVMDRVVHGEYATGVSPVGVNWRPGDDPSALVKIDQPQLSDQAISELLVESRIGEYAASLMNADMVQAWAVQLLLKPPAATGWGSVGWHQDDDYWHNWWDGEVFTCWLALSDVTAEAGPLRFVPRSHRWGYLASGNFFSPELGDGREKFPIPDGEAWQEVEAVPPAGGASFHHRRTIHGSGINTSSGPRRSYAVHLRTDRSTPLAGAPAPYRDHLDDPAVCPVLFER